MTAAKKNCVLLGDALYYPNSEQGWALSSHQTSRATSDNHRVICEDVIYEKHGFAFEQIGAYSPNCEFEANDLVAVTVDYCAREIAAVWCKRRDPSQVGDLRRDFVSWLKNTNPSISGFEEVYPAGMYPAGVYPAGKTKAKKQEEEIVVRCAFCEERSTHHVPLTRDAAAGVTAAGITLPVCEPHLLTGETYVHRLNGGGMVDSPEARAEVLRYMADFYAWAKLEEAKGVGFRTQLDRIPHTPSLEERSVATRQPVEEPTAGETPHYEWP